MSGSGGRRLALVTGAGQGIGAAIARGLAGAGAAVIVAARSQEACTRVADEIRGAGGVAWGVYIDVTEPETYDDAMAELAEELAPWPRVDWLINNAGIAQTAPFLKHGRDLGVDQYERHMRVNFHGPRRAIERFAPNMIEAGYGRIVNLASSAGLHGYRYSAAYVASKHALVGYTRCAARELEKKGVTMNAVCPHYVDTPMTDETVARIIKKTGRSEEETRAFLAAQNPGGSLIAPDEVARVVIDLVQGSRNAAVAELVGGRGILPDAETVVWRE